MTIVNNIGAAIKSVACGGSMATAAGTGDNTAVTGVSIDRAGYESAKVTVGYLTTLTADKTLSLAIAYQTSSDNSNWDTAVSLQDATVAKTGAATAAVGQVSHSLDLRTLKRYIRFNYTPDLSHSGTDTAVTFCVADLGGAETMPAV